MNTTRRTMAGLAVALLAAVGFVATRPRPAPQRPTPSETVAETPSERPAPYAERVAYPRAGEPEAEPETEPAPATPPPGTEKLVALAPIERGPTAVPDRVTITRSMTALVGDYQAAVCACRTRTCVRALQGSFIQQLGSAEFDQTRDGDAFAEASHTTRKCYLALPESS
jgi:hypothetical protein